MKNTILRLLFIVSANAAFAAGKPCDQVLDVISEPELPVRVVSVAHTGKFLSKYPKAGDVYTSITPEFKKVILHSITNFNYLPSQIDSFRVVQVIPSGNGKTGHLIRFEALDGKSEYVGTLRFNNSNIAE